MKPFAGLSGVNRRDLALLHAALLLYSVVGVFTKLASGALNREALPAALLYFGLALLMMVGYTILWQRALGRMPLGFAYSNKGVCTLWTCLLGLAFFGEAMTWMKALGLLVTVAGVTLVVTEHE